MSEESFTLDLLSKTIRDKRYAVGRCVVTIGGGQIEAVAVVAGDDRSAAGASILCSG